MLPVRKPETAVAPATLTGRPGHGGRRDGRNGRGGRGRLVVRRRRRGRQRLRRPGRDRFGLGRVHAAVTALRVLHRRVVVALAEELGAGRGFRRAFGSAAAANRAGGRGSGRRVRGFRRRHRVVLLPFRPPVLEPYFHLRTTTGKRLENRRCGFEQRFFLFFLELYSLHRISNSITRISKT